VAHVQRTCEAHDTVLMTIDQYPWLRVYALKSEYVLDLRLLVVCVHIFWFSFSEEKTCWRKKQLVQDLIPPPPEHIHTHVYFVNKYEYVYAEIWSIWILRALQVCPLDPWVYNRVPHLCRVCLCARSHTHTPTYTPTRVRNREDTDYTPTSIFPSVKK